LPDPTLSIVIVNWNVRELLERCLASIQTHLQGEALEVIVVDNASHDGSAAMLAESYPWVQCIENGENLGFAAANNQAFRVAKGDYLLLLNPDTELRARSIQTLLEVLEKKPEVGLVGPRIVNQDGSIVRPCRRKNISLWGISKGLFLTDQIFDRVMNGLFGARWRKFADRDYATSGRTQCLQGSCMLMRRRDLLKVGYFDERIPLYLDDGDLCQRFQNAGFRIFFSAEAEIIHHGAKSVAKMANSRMSSMVGCLAIDTFFLKHRSKAHVFVYHLMLFFSSCVFLIIDVVLLPFLWFTKRKFIRNYLVKHFWSLIYSVSFQFRTKALPPTWPRRLKDVLRAPMNVAPDNLPPNRNSGSRLSASS